MEERVKSLHEQLVQKANWYWHIYLYCIFKASDLWKSGGENRESLIIIESSRRYKNLKKLSTQTRIQYEKCCTICGALHALLKGYKYHI